MVNWLNFFKVLRRKPPHIEALATHNHFSGLNSIETASHNRIYTLSPWVYVAVNRIAEACALVPLKVYRVQGDQKLEVVQHPLEILLDNPNPYMSR
ncbi:MAG: phage portal protein, partial [Chloroflexi bacterium]